MFVVWLACLARISLLNFVHHGFEKDQIRMGEIITSVPTCLNLLCPLVFTIYYYFNRGQFVELVLSVQIVSEEWYRKLRRIAIVYTDSFSLVSCGFAFRCSLETLFYQDFQYVDAFERTHTIYVVFHSRGFYDVPRVLITDARSFEVFSAILDYVTHLASMSCWYRSDARQDKFRLSEAALL